MPPIQVSIPKMSTISWGKFFLKESLTFSPCCQVRDPSHVFGSFFVKKSPKNGPLKKSPIKMVPSKRSPNECVQDFFMMYACWPGGAAETDTVMRSIFLQNWWILLLLQDRIRKILPDLNYTIHILQNWKFNIQNFIKKRNFRRITCVFD